MILFHRNRAKSSVSIYKNPWKTYKSNFSYKHLHLIIYSQDSTRQYRIAASTSVNIRTNDDVGDTGCVSISKFVSLKAFLQHSPPSSSTLYEISYHSLILLRTICPHTLHPSRDKIRSCSSVARRENNPLRRKHRTWCSKREKWIVPWFADENFRIFVIFSSIIFSYRWTYDIRRTLHLSWASKSYYSLLLLLDENSSKDFS